MAAVAIAGIGMMMVCSSSLAAVMLMGGEEETPASNTTTSADPTGDEDDDTGDDDSGDEDDDTEDDDSGGGGGEEESDTSAVEYHWEVESFKTISGGEPFKTVNNASASKCRKKCEKKNECVGFNIGPIIGTKRCVLYSGDVSTVNSLNDNTHLLSRV
jgi:cobalamin biosynthesis protein CobT